MATFSISSRSGRGFPRQLIERDLLGIAADMAEAARGGWGGPGRSRRPPCSAVAAARAPQRDYGQDTIRFTAHCRTGDELRVSGDLEAVVLFGGLIRPAILQAPADLPPADAPRWREAGSASTCSRRLRTISELGFDFPPSTDELARLAGASKVPQRQRLVEKLGDWCDAMAGRTSRWQFATVFMHQVVSDEGLIGAARRAIEAGRPDALALASAAIEKLDSPSQIETRSEEFAGQHRAANQRSPLSRRGSSTSIAISPRRWATLPTGCG